MKTTEFFWYRIAIICALLAFILLWCSGCTSIYTKQSESDGKITKSTEVRIQSFFDSSAKVSKLRASTTDKSQSSSIGEAATEASGTNTVDLLQAVSAGMTQGAIKALAK